MTVQAAPDENITERLLDLKSALLTLKPSGSDGFEGFVRTALTELTGIPFRLAASGLQGGIDGDAVLQSDSVCFEAKRYTGKIERNDVLTKIVDLARHNDAPDRLWILGATTEISTQLASAIREAGDQHAISTLILDWTATPLPLLAVGAVAAGDIAINFLTTNCVPTIDRDKLFKVFEDISKHPDFECILYRIKSNLNISALATTRSIEVNKAWRAVTFGSVNTARERLGQALAIRVPQNLQTLRKALRDKVRSTLQAGEGIIIYGGEGHGKSWLAAQICYDHEGVALFASAERFERADTELDSILIELLIEQTGDVLDETIKLRWRHRLTAWRSHPPISSLLVVVDGMNQRQNLRWDRILNGLRNRLLEIGGSLVVTVRPQFWQKTVAPGLNFKPKLIEVPEWSPSERNILLKHHHIELHWLDNATLQTLRNPRLLAVSVATLPHHGAAWKGLTTDRILLEHLRASQRENFEDETLKNLTERLSNHAKEVLERLRASSNELSQSFEAESTAVIETRFFQALPGPGNSYELREGGLTLALGYTLIDQLWQARRSGLNLGERMAHIIDPIYALDRTVDVIFASLMICTLDPIRFHHTIFTTLLDAFSSLQNIDDQRFEEFVEIIKYQPNELFNALELFTLERGRRLNQDWFIHAAFEVTATEEGWPVAEAAIRQWLNCYNKDAVEQTNRYPKHDEDTYKENLHNRRKGIQDILSSLSPFEQELLDQMTEISGETDSLFSLALQLLAGHPLAEFANCFITLGLGFSLDKDTGFSRKAFHQLTTFNRTDREHSKELFLRAIEPLRSSDSSLAGQWTIVRMLYATGYETAALEASSIAEKLSDNHYYYKKFSTNELRDTCVANPVMTRPVDMDQGLENFNDINQDHILSAMGLTDEDYKYREFLPIACRFEPQAAVDKTRRILSGLLTRTGFSLRQLIFNSTEYAPLMSRGMAVQLISRVIDTDMIENLKEREQDTLRMFLFYYVAPQLSPSEQLDCLTSPAFGPSVLLKAIPCLKPQPTCAILKSLREAIETNDTEAAYGALVAARFGDTPMTPELESLVLQCASFEASELRALSFELAIQRDLKTVRDLHVRSDWSARTTDTRTYDSWFGSILLAKAYAKHELEIDELLNRASPEALFSATDIITDTITKSLAKHFSHRLLGAVVSINNLVPPAVDLTLSKNFRASFPLLSINAANRTDDRFNTQKTFKEIFKKDEDFDEKQDNLHAIYNKFFEELENSDARLLIERISIEDIEFLILSNHLLLPRVLEILKKANDTEFAWLKNIALVVANILSKDKPDKAVYLFQRASKIQGIVTYDLCDEVTFEHKAIWSSEPSEVIADFWRQRLLKSSNDETLAREVLAAERFGAADFIKDFVNELTDSTSTLDQAYAISVAGFSTQSEQLYYTILNHLEDMGITGTAAKQAKDAHEHGQWATKWLHELCIADNPEEFWQYLMILKTCMDARTSADQILNSKWSQYTNLFIEVRNSAIKEKNKTRKKTLLGQEKPNILFVN